MAHDYNWGFLTVVGLCTATPWEMEIKGDEQGITAKKSGTGRRGKVALAKCKEKYVKVRVKEMSEGHAGLDVPQKLLKRLAGRPKAARVDIPGVPVGRTTGFRSEGNLLTTDGR